MELRRTETGFALYKEKEVIGHCTLHPAAQGADLAALAIDPAWRRKGYGSYLLKEVLRSFGGYDREAATVFTAPLPADCAEMAFWAKFGFAAEGPQLVRRRTPDLTAVKFVQDFLAARLVHPRLCAETWSPWASSRLIWFRSACSHISMTATRRCRSMAEVQRCFLPASQSHGLSMKGCRSTVRTRKLPMTMWTWMFPALL